MKMSFLFALFCTMGPAAMAAPAKYPECHKDVNWPKGAGSYYFDGDCSTIYVFPDTGRTEFKIVAQAADLEAVCGRIAANDNKMLEIANANLADSRRLLQAAKAGEDVTAMLDQMDKARAERKKQEDAIEAETVNIGAREAETVEVRYFSNLDQTIQAYQRANPGLKVKALPRDSAVISMSEQSEDEFRRDVREAKMSMHLEKVDADPVFKAPVFHEGIKAKLRLSYFGVCGQSGTDYLQAYSAGTLTYSYQLSGETFYGTAAFL